MPFADRRRTALVAASAALLLLAQTLALSVRAEGTSAPPAQLDTPGGTPPSVQAIVPFLEQVLADQLGLLGIPGATLAVRHGDAILHLAGDGRAGLQDGRPVSPEDTRFRVGSVAKPLTWTAAMQLVEQGRLDLHGDVDLGRGSGFQGPPHHPQLHHKGLHLSGAGGD